MRDNYKFILDINGDSQQAYPIYDDKLSLKYEKESKQVFLRAQLDGKLKFVKTDYDRIVKAAFDTVFYVNILKYNTNTAQFEDFFKGKFTKTKCKFNIDDQIVEVKLDTVDAYEDVLAGLDKEFDLIKLAPEIQPVQLQKRPAFQLYTPGEKVISSFVGGVYWEQECEQIWDLNILNSEHGFILEPKIIDINNISEADFYASRCSTAERVCYPVDNYTVRELYPGTWYIFVYDSRGTFDVEYDIANQTATINGKHATELSRNSDEIIFNDPLDSDLFVKVPIIPYIPPKQFVNRVLHDKDSYDGSKVNIKNKETFGSNKNYIYATPLDWDSFDINVIPYSELSAEPTEFGQSQPGLYYKKPVYPATLGFGNIMPISRSQWGSVSYWFSSALLSQIDEVFRELYVVEHTYPLYSCIQVLLNKIAPDVIFAGTENHSKFFYSSYNPISYDSFRLCIAPISNILAGDYDQPAQKAPVTLEKILSMLESCYRCYWFIDSSSRLRIEHISYFNNGMSYDSYEPDYIDTTELFSSRIRKYWSFATTKFEYDFENLPERYEFKWADDVSKPFEGWPIEIKSNYVKKGQIENISAAPFSSDVDMMLLQPESFNKDTLAILAVNTGSTAVPDVKYLEREYMYGHANSEKYNMQNGLLSFFDLVPKYYTRDMPGSNVIINDQPSYELPELDTLGGIGVKRAKKQEIEYPNGFEINPYKLIKTELGIGQIEKLEINLSSELAKITILHDTEE